jgi:glycosyltransferase involved in cell wall biosynthesis
MAPLVSVGIPAFNRAEGLERAARSVLEQTLDDLELVISDDASQAPDVARVGERLAAADARVRYTRQPRNLGHVRNYRWVLAASRGRFFMWLSDDDWLDPRYVERCLSELRPEPRRRLVCGQASYYAGGTLVAKERPIDLSARRPGARLLGYYSRVNMNGPLFGVARRDDLLQIPFPEVVGGDWLLVAALASRGEVRTLRDVHVHRSMEGLGGDAEALGRSFGLPRPLARWHHVLVASNVWRQIAREGWGSPPGRLVTATLCALVLLLRYPAVHLLRSAGLGPIEERLVARARRRRA